MSTSHDRGYLNADGMPELTPLGKRLELLRIERRLSKSVLAQRAGTSRQQLWRVMTGKSELTGSLCARLADVLEIDSRVLRDAPGERDGLGAALARRGVRWSDVSEASGWADVSESSSAAAQPAPSNSNARVLAAQVDQTFEPDQSFEAYVADSRGLERTLETLPMTEDGRRLKRALLDAIEDIAVERSLRLSPGLFELRRRVINGDR
jgi:transcriptional regulator with XRE-family HTH domain